MITPVIFFSLVIGMINGFQYFTQAYTAAIAVGADSVPISGTPQNSLMFYSIYLYKQGFNYFRMGYASAMAWVLFIITMVCTVLIDQDVEALGALPGRDVPIATTGTTDAAFEHRSAMTVRRHRSAAGAPEDATSSAASSRSSTTRLLISVAAMLPRAVRVRGADVVHDRGASADTPSLWPRPFQPSNYTEVFTTISIVRYTWNTVQIAILSTIGVLLSSIPVAYALARMRWRGRQAAFLLVLATLMLPVQVTIVPLYIMFVRLGWIGHLTPLIVPAFFGDAFSIFLLRQFFMTIPAGAVRRRARGRRERVADHDAGRSCRWRSRRSPRWRLFSFLYSWNDLFGPLLFVGNNPKLYTLAIGLTEFTQRLRHGLGADDGGLGLDHAAGHRPVLPRAEGRSSKA